MSIQYLSTRGHAAKLPFRSVALGGLAPDGGLYVPETWPRFSPADLKALGGKDYIEIAQRILIPFVGNDLSLDELKTLLEKAYASFDEFAITPLRQLDEQHWVLELFHGPTYAFKDIALQLLGQIFEYYLSQTKRHMTVIGATSGDTGSAAIAALAGRRYVDVFILYPQKGPSEIQRKQMTCVDAENVHALAVDGSFDDCQAIVKALFNDQAQREKFNFAAVNSINWLRVLAQMVYYFAAAATFGGRPVSFAVPTGNFGNVYAAYAANKCGLAISKLAVASNRNDILTRFFTSGLMRREQVELSLSPSMDIQISSNFERLLFDLCGGKGPKVTSLMEQLTRDGSFAVSPMQLAMARQIFTAARVDDEETLATIRDIYKETGYVLDPHSAVGVAASRKLAAELPDPVILLSCAHPGKFPETIKRALGEAPSPPPALAALLKKSERQTFLKADQGEVLRYIEDHVDMVNARS